MSVWRRALSQLPVMLLTILCFFSGPAFVAAQAVDPLNTLARKIGEALSKNNFKSATLQVTGPTSFPTAGPAYIRERLVPALEERGVSIKRSRADAGIDCKLLMQPEDATKSLNVKIKANIVDRNDQLIAGVSGIELDLTNEELIAKLSGGPVFRLASNPITPSGSGSSPLGAAIFNGVTNPNQSVTKRTIARAEENSPLGMEILVGGTPKSLKIDDGLAYVDLAERDEFEVRLSSDAAFEVAVELRLDGIDSTHPSGEKYLWLIPPGSNKTISGWFYGNNRFKAFTVVPTEESVAAKLGNATDLGVITAVFRRSYREGEATDEPNIRTAAIGEGRELKIDVSEQRRTFGALLGQIPIRYERPTGN